MHPSSRRVEIAILYDKDAYAGVLVYKAHRFYESVRELKTCKSVGQQRSDVLRS